MPARKSVKEPQAAVAAIPRQQALLKRIYELYAEYTGQEIAQAIGEYRAEETARQEQIKIKEEIARLQSQIVE